MPDSRPLDQQRWVECENVGSQAIPSWGVVEITGVVNTDGQRMVLQVRRPTAANRTTVAVNFISPIAVNGFGKCTLSVPMFALYDTANSPANGEEWGTQANLFTLKKANTGFLIHGGLEGSGVTSRVEVQRAFGGASADDAKIGKTNTIVAAKSGSTMGGTTDNVDIFEATGGTLSITSGPSKLTGYNPNEEAIPSGTFVLCNRESETSEYVLEYLVAGFTFAAAGIGGTGSERIQPTDTLTVLANVSDLGSDVHDIARASTVVFDTVKMAFTTCTGLVTADFTASDTTLTDDGTNSVDGVTTLMGKAIPVSPNDVLAADTVLNSIGASGSNNDRVFLSFDHTAGKWEITTPPSSGSFTLTGKTPSSELVSNDDTLELVVESTDKGPTTHTISKAAAVVTDAIEMSLMFVTGLVTADFTSSDTTLTDDGTNSVDGVTTLLGKNVASTIAKLTVKNSIGASGSNNDRVFLVRDHTANFWEIIEAPPVDPGSGDAIFGFSLNENMGATTTDEAAADKLNLDGAWSDTTDDITVSDVQSAETGALNGELGICVQPGGTGTFFQIIRIYRKARQIRFTVNETNGFEITDSSFAATMDDSSDGVAPVAVDGAITIFNPEAEDTGGGTFFRFSGNDNAEGTALYHFTEDKYYVESIESPDAAGSMSQIITQTLDATSTAKVVAFNTGGSLSKRGVTDLANERLTTQLVGVYNIWGSIRYKINSGSAVAGVAYSLTLSIVNTSSAVIATAASQIVHKTTGVQETSAHVEFQGIVLAGAVYELKINTADLQVDVSEARFGLKRISDAGSN